MRVSAISALSYPTTYYVYPIKAKNTDNNSDTTFNSLSSYQKKNEPDNKDLNKIYQTINEWKDFCHSQIAKGKLDIIA